MSSFTHKILNIYNKIVNEDLIFKTSTLKEAYEQVTEQGVDRFGPNNIYENYTQWTALQKSLYLEKFGDKSTGPGEGSVAMLLFQAAHPEIPEELILQNYIKDIQKMVRHTGTSTVDIHDPETGYFYEVKEASEGKSVMVGAESRGIALQIYNQVKEDFFKLYEIYVKLTPQHKAYIEKHKPGFKKTMDEIFTSAYDYFITKPGELARGSIMRLKRETPTPKLFLIPLYFNEELLSDPMIKDVVPDTVEFIQNLYNVSEIDARIIDKNTRDYIEDKKNKQNPTSTSVDPDAALSDFLLISQTTVFASPERFATAIQSYFIPGTEQSTTTLKRIFPNTGVFLVDPIRGYLYAGKENVGRLLRIDNITKGIFKVVPVTAPEVTAPSVGL